MPFTSPYNCQCQGCRANRGEQSIHINNGVTYLCEGTQVTSPYFINTILQNIPNYTSFDIPLETNIIPLIIPPKKEEIKFRRFNGVTIIKMNFNYKLNIK